MKKITLIACAALVAGFLMSCSSEAGVKDYNNVTTTSTYNSYVVKGTIATTVETSSKRFDDENKQTNGSSSSITTTQRFVSTPAYVSFGTDENYDGNCAAAYSIKIDGTDVFTSEVANSATYWDSAAKEEKSRTAAEIKSYNDAHKEADDPDDSITAIRFSLIVIDDVIYYESNGERFVVTADAEKIAEGESFDLDVTFVTNDESSNYTYYDSDGDQYSRNESADKTSVTYKFSFTAK